ncbi:hypothetical protein HYH03_011217 [Edaphochlamys debaryana]|uniref:Guanylate cyclase domain-containing protein n=1 Tax=Edaphochlamys debaryana TaxID=47281 RepID=A0A835XS96_9CHLO|nr:hypothetical protein HYH03_011217 [Edaphochlamys debaryana]|eukprot:KAG2490262.1 hypothetical protein HYH03_011217 [Edaphochlamys debaryana]
MQQCWREDPGGGGGPFDDPGGRSIEDAPLGALLIRLSFDTPEAGAVQHARFQDKGVNARAPRSADGRGGGTAASAAVTQPRAGTPGREGPSGRLLDLAWEGLPACVTVFTAEGAVAFQNAASRTYMGIFSCLSTHPNRCRAANALGLDTLLTATPSCADLLRLLSPPGGGILSANPSAGRSRRGAGLDSTGDDGKGDYCDGGGDVAAPVGGRGDCVRQVEAAEVRIEVDGCEGGGGSNMLSRLFALDPSKLEQLLEATQLLGPTVSPGAWEGIVPVPALMASPSARPTTSATLLDCAARAHSAALVSGDGSGEGLAGPSPDGVREASSLLLGATAFSPRRLALGRNSAAIAMAHGPLRPTGDGAPAASGLGGVGGGQQARQAQHETVEAQHAREEAPSCSEGWGAEDCAAVISEARARATRRCSEVLYVPVSYGPTSRKADGPAPVSDVARNRSSEDRAGQDPTQTHMRLLEDSAGRAPADEGSRDRQQLTPGAPLGRSLSLLGLSLPPESAPLLGQPSSARVARDSPAPQSISHESTVGAAASKQSDGLREYPCTDGAVQSGSGILLRSVLTLDPPACLLGEAGFSGLSSSGTASRQRPKDRRLSSAQRFTSTCPLATSTWGLLLNTQTQALEAATQAVSTGQGAVSSCLREVERRESFGGTLQYLVPSREASTDVFSTGSHAAANPTAPLRSGSLRPCHSPAAAWAHAPAPTSAVPGALLTPSLASGDANLPGARLLDTHTSAAGFASGAAAAAAAGAAASHSRPSGAGATGEERSSCSDTLGPLLSTLEPIRTVSGRWRRPSRSCTTVLPGRPTAVQPPIVGPAQPALTLALTPPGEAEALLAGVGPQDAGPNERPTPKLTRCASQSLSQARGGGDTREHQCAPQSEDASNCGRYGAIGSGGRLGSSLAARRTQQRLGLLSPLILGLGGPGLGPGSPGTSQASSPTSRDGFAAAACTESGGARAALAQGSAPRLLQFATSLNTAPLPILGAPSLNGGNSEGGSGSGAASGSRAERGSVFRARSTIAPVSVVSGCTASVHRNRAQRAAPRRTGSVCLESGGLGGGPGGAGRNATSPQLELPPSSLVSASVLGNQTGFACSAALSSRNTETAPLPLAKCDGLPSLVDGVYEQAMSYLQDPDRPAILIGNGPPGEIQQHASNLDLDLDQESEEHPAVAGHEQPRLAWHEVHAAAVEDPDSGARYLVVMQRDVTAKVEAERHIAQVAEIEHRLLEQVFPRHVLAYMTEEGCQPAAAPEDEGPGADNAAPSTPTWRPQVRDCTRLATWHLQVTILFADIQGFTPMCKQLPACVVMKFLNDLFVRFDSLLDVHGVYKVETIGDCYVVAGGLIAEDGDGMAAVQGGGVSDPRQADQVFSFAQAMLHAAAAVTLPTTGEPVRIRVGIHSGPVVSGVVGTRMPRFCLFGDTVNTASRMESTSQAGAIHASSDTFALLSPDQRRGWAPTGGIEVKGKGRMDTHLWGGSAAAADLEYGKA